MNITELWFGQGKKFDRIFDQLAKIRDELSCIKVGIGVLKNDHQLILTQLTTMKAQLDRIEEAIGGSEAATLIVKVGVPTEQT